ncbi:hypothetical protein GW846_03385 [Candidatus Gracilibacteria bacterium]|nr:hypothetical protein [Candidatus Gracilibacteria bacterium]
MENDLVGPDRLESLNNAVGKIVDVEDFSGNLEKFKIIKYGSDLITFEVLEGEYSGAKLQFDLGTNSTLDVTIKNISLDGNEIFGEKLIQKNNIERAHLFKNKLDVRHAVDLARDEYRKKIHNLMSICPSGDYSGIQSLVKEIGARYQQDGIVEPENIIIV